MDFFSAFEVKPTQEQLSKAPFLFLSNHPKKFNIQAQNYLRDVNYTNEHLTALFYSDENQEIIQKQIVLEVFKERNIKIGFQSSERLLTLMKYVYEDMMPRVITVYNNVTDMIRELNKTIVREAVHGNGAILSNLDHTMFYLDDISKNPVPIALPVNVGKKGTKLLPSMR